MSTHTITMHDCQLTVRVSRDDDGCVHVGVTDISINTELRHEIGPLRAAEMLEIPAVHLLQQIAQQVQQDMADNAA